MATNMSGEFDGFRRKGWPVCASAAFDAWSSISAAGRHDFRFEQSGRSDCTHESRSGSAAAFKDRTMGCGTNAPRWESRECVVRTRWGTLVRLRFNLADATMERRRGSVPPLVFREEWTNLLLARTGISGSGATCTRERSTPRSFVFEQHDFLVLLPRRVTPRWPKMRREEF